MQTNKKPVVVKSQGMLKTEALMEDIVMKLNRDGVTAQDLAEKHGLSKGYISIIAGVMRKQGIEVAMLRKGSFYKDIIEQWKKEKPELFTNYGLKPRR